MADSTTSTRRHAPGAGPGPVVLLQGLTRRYGDRLAVDGVSFDLPRGTITGFVGPNGAGKTTTMRMLLGLIRATDGTAELDGAPMGSAAALRRVGAMIEGPAFHPGLSARRNLRLLAHLGGVADDRVDAVLASAGLVERADDRVKGYSLGMRQRLGIAAALLTEPRVLLLDEPTNGLDPAGIREVRALLRTLADGGVTVLVSSHLLAEVEQICDRLVMIRDGQVLFAGELAELVARQRVELVARPRGASAVVDELVECLGDAGVVARRDGDEVRVSGPIDGGRLNELAFAAGVVLRELRTERESLEQTFFALLETAGLAAGAGIGPALAAAEPAVDDAAATAIATATGRTAADR